jgi:hypothetical protein
LPAASNLDPLTGLPRKSGSYPYTDPFIRTVNAGQAQYDAGNQAINDYSGVSSPGGGRKFDPVTIPGFTPDYASLIQGDPIFGQLKADLSAHGISDAASRAAATQRALIQFGAVPEFDGLAGLNRGYLDSDVNQTTRQLAQKNTEAGFSVVARQQKRLSDNIRAIKNALAARGALRSGETGHQLQEAQRGHDEARYDATQQILDYISGAQQGFLAAERARLGQLRGGAESAFERQMRLNPATGSRVINPGDPDYPYPAEEAASADTSGGGGYTGSVGAYSNPYLTAEQRAKEYENRTRRLGRDSALLGL